MHIDLGSLHILLWPSGQARRWLVVAMLTPILLLIGQPVLPHHSRLSWCQSCQSLLSQTLHFQSLTHKAVQWRQGFRPEDQLEGQDSLICIHHVKNKRYSACPITEYSRCGQPLLCFTARQDVLASVLRKTLHEYIGNKSKKLGGPPLLRGNEWNLISSFCVGGEHSGSLLTSELAALMVHGSGG